METSLQTDIPYYICYRFVRTVMERIASSSYKSDNVKLAWVIEAHEFYIKAGLKGRSYHAWDIEFWKTTTTGERTQGMER